MNREIKFRAWVDWGFNEMINDYCFLDSDMSFMGHDRTNNNYKVISVMQFTGMKDCEGVDIYEGDVLEGTISKWKVIFKNGCFLLEELYSSDFLTMFEANFKVIKIIGNIYQNPELL
jgi:hypothetical protein